MTIEELEKLKHAPAVEGIPAILLQRWSPRGFADKDVPPAVLEKLFIAASWAASSSNEQPWRFLVGRRGDETYKKIFNSLVEFNQSWAKSAPVLVLSVARMMSGQNGKPNAYGLHDTGAATANFSLAATGLGLHTHSMAGFDKDTARASFGVPSDYEIGAVAAVGYLGDPSSLSEQLRERELAPRTRKPLSEFVFADWEKAATF